MHKNPLPALITAMAFVIVDQPRNLYIAEAHNCGNH